MLVDRSIAGFKPHVADLPLAVVPKSPVREPRVLIAMGLPGEAGEREDGREACERCDATPWDASVRVVDRATTYELPGRESLGTEGERSRDRRLLGHRSAPEAPILGAVPVDAGAH